MNSQTKRNQRLNYTLQVTEPWTHYVKVKIEGSRDPGEDKVQFFMPVWSPGSYKVRDYAKHVRKVRALQSNGEFLYFEKVDKNNWLIDWSKSELNKSTTDFSFEYEIYCNEVSVRASHVNLTHAFIHGPSVFMGRMGFEDCPIELNVDFPPCWTKVSTALSDISPKREIFLYYAEDYDELIDTPLEIGCHETDGFRVDGKDHNLATLNLPARVAGPMKKDIKRIVETISRFWGGVPYESYTFLTHFFSQNYGGLEHRNSTALQFDPLEVGHKKGYLDYLGLVSHEYFHTWNVKRIRPQPLGPFDYHQENYTRMHWLTEGLTSYVDDLFVFNAGVSDKEYLLERMARKFNAYLKTPGRMFDSLEESSFDAWIKLYQPNENSRNSSISYYLKGALAFFCVHSLLYLQGRKLKELTDLLWQRYQSDPKNGVTKDEVLTMIESLGGQKVRDEFEKMIATTEELPLEESCKYIGLEVQWKTPEDLYWGFDWQNKNGNLFVHHVVLDGPAYKCGLNEGDEIVAHEGFRLTPQNYKAWEKTLKKGQPVELLIVRQGLLLTIDVAPEKSPKEIESLKILDSKKLESFLTII